MLPARIDLVFNGLDDSDLKAVDLPTAFLRLIANLITREGIHWTDASGNTVSPTEEEMNIIENAMGEVLIGIEL